MTYGNKTNWFNYITRSESQMEKSYSSQKQNVNATGRYTVSRFWPDFMRIGLLFPSRSIYTLWRCTAHIDVAIGNFHSPDESMSQSDIPEPPGKPTWRRFPSFWYSITAWLRIIFWGSWFDFMSWEIYFAVCEEIKNNKVCERKIITGSSCVGVESWLFSWRVVSRVQKVDTIKSRKFISKWNEPNSTQVLILLLFLLVILPKAISFPLAVGWLWFSRKVLGKNGWPPASTRYGCLNRCKRRVTKNQKFINVVRLSHRHCLVFNEDDELLFDS